MKRILFLVSFFMLFGCSYGKIEIEPCENGCIEFYDDQVVEENFEDITKSKVYTYDFEVVGEIKETK